MVIQKDRVARDIAYWSLAHVTAYANATRGWPILKTAGIDLSAKDEKGNVPLHIAVAGGNPATVRAILAVAPQTAYIKNQVGSTPSEEARLSESLVKAGILLDFANNVQKLGEVVDILPQNMALSQVVSEPIDDGSRNSAPLPSSVVEQRNTSTVVIAPPSSSEPGPTEINPDGGTESWEQLDAADITVICPREPVTWRWDSITTVAINFLRSPANAAVKPCKPK